MIRSHSPTASVVQNLLVPFSVAVVLCEIAAFFLLYTSSIDIAPDISDASYYIVNLIEDHEIQVQPHTFPKVWSIFFPSQNILINRITIAILVFVANCFICLAISKSKIEFNAPTIFLFLFSGLGGLSVFSTGLLEPSYNNIHIFFAALAVFVATFGIPHVLNTQLDLAIRSLLLGLLIVLLAIVKITTAVIATPLLLLVLLRSVKVDFTTRIILISCIFGVLGSCVALIILSMSGSPPGIIWDNFFAGYEALKLLESHEWSFQGEVTKIRTWLAGNFDSARVLSNNPFGILSAREYQNVVGLAYILSTISILIFFKRYLPDQINWPGALFVIALPYILTFGTNNTDISFHMASFSGVLFPLYFVALKNFLQNRKVAGQEHPGSYILFAITILLGVMMCAQIIRFAHYPYRFCGTLFEATEQISIGNGDDEVTLKASPLLAETYRSLAPHRTSIQKDEYPPALLDFTGRAPGVALALGARPPKIAWLVGGYSGSDRFLLHVLSDMPKSEVMASWLLLSDSGGFSAEVVSKFLHNNGLTLENDYLPVAKIPLNYIEYEAILFAPKKISEDTGSVHTRSAPPRRAKLTNTHDPM